MATNHETVWAALLERLKARAPGFRTYSRQTKDWGIEQMPALELWDNGAETPIGQETGLLAGWTISGEVALVARADEQVDHSPFSTLNDLSAAVREALERTPEDHDTGTAGWHTSLGARIERLTLGAVTKGGGAKSGDVVAKFTIEMDVY